MIENPETILKHTGKPNSADADFFAGPPEEIGEILSGYTDMSVSDNPVPEGKRIVTVFATAAVISCIAFAIPAKWFWIPLMVGLITGTFTYIFSEFYHQCSYIGSKGIALYELQKSREHPSNETVYLFEKARKLELQPYWESSKSETGNKGMYVKRYSFSWYDEQGTFLFRLPAQPGKIYPEDNDYRLALKAEQAWTQWVTPEFEKQFEQDNKLLFVFERTKHITLGKNYIGVPYKGEVLHIEKKDIESIKFCRDPDILKNEPRKPVLMTLVISDKSKKWRGEGGVFTLMVYEIPNRLLFQYFGEKYLKS